MHGDGTLYAHERVVCLTDRFGASIAPDFIPSESLLELIAGRDNAFIACDPDTDEVGILLEWEFIHNDSDDSAESVAEAWNMSRTHTTKDLVQSRLLDRSTVISRDFPEIPIWVAVGDHIEGNRVALCGFISGDNLNDQTINDFVSRVISADEAEVNAQWNVDRTSAVRLG